MQDHVVHASGRRKNVCASYCLVAMGIPTWRFRYAETVSDVLRILRRHGYSVRSRRSRLPKAATMGDVRRWLARNGQQGERYLVRVPGHALLVDHQGRVVVDTDPREVDRRRVTHFYRVA